MPPARLRHIYRTHIELHKIIFVSYARIRWKCRQYRSFLPCLAHAGYNFNAFTLLLHKGYALESLKRDREQRSTVQRLWYWMWRCRGLAVGYTAALGSALQQHLHHRLAFTGYLEHCHHARNIVEPRSSVPEAMRSLPHQHSRYPYHQPGG